MSHGFAANFAYQSVLPDDHGHRLFLAGSASGHSLLYCGPEADLCGQQPDWCQ